MFTTLGEVHKKSPSYENELQTAFDEHFEIVDADTPALLAEVFRLRYRVYCEERLVPDFEPWKFTDHLEKDEYDARSVHCLMRDRATGAPAGTVRLILADPSDSTKPFPIEEYAACHFDRSLVEPSTLPRRHTAEISRLVVAKRFRSRSGEDGKPSEEGDHMIEGDPHGRRRFPHPILGLCVAITRMSAQHGITHWYAAMEPWLHRLLSRFHLNLTPIGPMVEYHGLRRPYLSVAAEVLGIAYERRRDIWNLLTDRGRVWPAP